MTEREPIPPRRSPDGRVEVRFAADEVAMGDWIGRPVVVRTRDGHVVVSLADTVWDASLASAYPAPDRVALQVRRFPDGMPFTRVLVDVERETFGLGDAEPDRPVGGLRAALEEAYERVIAARAPDLLGQGFCPHCQAPLHAGRLDRLLRRRTVRCLVCGRDWPLR